jgi:hypothetical protein
MDFINNNIYDKNININKTNDNMILPINSLLIRDDMDETSKIMIIKYLSNHGLDLNIKDKEYYPLDICIINKLHNVIDYINKNNLTNKFSTGSVIILLLNNKTIKDDNDYRKMIGNNK